MASSSKNISDMDLDGNISSEYEDIANSTVSEGGNGHFSESESDPVLPAAFKQFQEYLDRKLTHIDKLEKIDNLEKLLCNNIKQHDTRISQLETDNLRLKQQNDRLSKDVEMLTKELRNKNLIIHGLSETESESPAQLKEVVSSLMSKITEKNVSIDVAYRLGQKKENTNRHVRVSFLSQSDRNMVYENRMKTKKGIFINEDLHKDTRRNLALLRRKRKELTEQQIKCNINYSTLTLETESGEVFCVHDGAIINKNKQKAPESTQPNSKNGRAVKRKGRVPDPELIGKDNLRQKNAKIQRTGN